MEKTKITAPIELVFIITDRGKAESAIKILNKKPSKYHVVCSAEGSSDSLKSELFGFDIKERDFVIAIIDVEEDEDILNELSKKLKFYIPDNGLAFTVPISSVGNDLLDLLNIGY